MFLDKEINDIYLYEVLRTFGMDLIGLFIPIYIISQGFGFEYALGFLMIEQLTGIVLSLPVSHIIARIGFKHSLALSYIFLLPALLLIRSTPLTLTVIAGSSIIYGIGKTLHSVSIDSEFAVDSHSKKRDSESSKMLGLPNISRILAPVTGGVILNQLGFSFLVSTSIAFFLLSAVVLFRSEDHRDPLDYDIKDVVKQNYAKTFPVFFFRGILNSAAVTAFALFTFFFIGSEIDAGAVAAIDNIGLLAVALISGKLSQRFGRAKIITAGLLSSSAIHFLRTIVSTPAQALAVSGIGGVVFMMYEVPLFSDFADVAEDEDVLEFYTVKRIIFKAGQITTIGLITGIGLHSGLKQGFQAAFILAGLVSASSILWTRKDW
ncbi:hypothetical protein [Candidatus Nanohalovita haloferacivicina]|uniref:hypothetical protein n=1 Tax=Candidatus Nanohalovita haloferacivicina TaxID=2978046 RepID=UPI00325FB951|nr:MFS family permease [Candidatus Nanohalobia archaeon BNXNv]